MNVGEITRDELVTVAVAAMNARLMSDPLRKALEHAGLVDHAGRPTAKAAALANEGVEQPASQAYRSKLATDRDIA